MEQRTPVVELSDVVEKARLLNELRKQEKRDRDEQNPTPYAKDLYRTLPYDRMM